MKLFKFFSKSVDWRTNTNLSAMSTASFAIALTTFGFLTLPAIAQIETIVLFQPPPESEQPESTEGAASRQSRVCASDLKTQQAQSDRLKLSSIVPQNNFGLTTAERPTFWVYIPETSARQVILSIKQEGNSPHWQQSIDLKGKAGITGIKLADDAPALELGKNYQWAIVLVCGDRPSPNDPVNTAWIKRIELAEGEPIPTEALAKAAVLAEQGIWYDTLDILAAQEPSVDNWQVWIEYLKSGGLDRVANEPINLD